MRNAPRDQTGFFQVDAPRSVRLFACWSKAPLVWLALPAVSFDEYYIAGVELNQKSQTSSTACYDLLIYGCEDVVIY